MTKKQIIAKYEPVIDEYLHHRTKTIDRRREIELQKLDEENCKHTGTIKDIVGCNTCYKGQYAKQRQQRITYEKWAWRALWVLCGLVLLAGLFI